MPRKQEDIVQPFRIVTYGLGRDPQEISISELRTGYPDLLALTWTCPNCGEWLASGMPVFSRTSLAQRFFRRESVLASRDEYQCARDLWAEQCRATKAQKDAESNARERVRERLLSAYRSDGHRAVITQFEQRHTALLDTHAFDVDCFLGKARRELPRSTDFVFEQRRDLIKRINEFLDSLELSERLDLKNMSLEEVARLLPVFPNVYSRLWLSEAIERRFRPIVPPDPAKADDNCLTGEEFERQLCDQLLAAGLRVEPTPRTGDMGVDLLVRHRDRVLAIQVKRYSSSVGPEAVREVHAGRTHYSATEAWVITNSIFTPQATREAKSLGVNLLSGESLPFLIESLGLQSHPLTEPVSETAESVRSGEAASVAGPEEKRSGVDVRAWVVAACAIILAAFAGLSWRSDDREQQLAKTIEAWKAAILRQDAAALSERFYAAKVERYYLKRDVSAVEVERAWRSLSSQYHKIEQLEFRNIKFDWVNSDRAAVVFDKRWKMTGSGTFEGEVQQRLVLVRLGKAWRIAQEFDSEIYWVKRRK